MCLNGLLISAEYEFCRTKYKFVEKKVELIEVRATCSCSENGENMKIDAINVKITTIDEAGSNRFMRRDMKFFNEIDE
jgi:hypothetical protein